MIENYWKHCKFLTTLKPECTQIWQFVFCHIYLATQPESFENLRKCFLGYALNWKYGQILVSFLQDHEWHHWRCTDWNDCQISFASSAFYICIFPLFGSVLFRFLKDICAVANRYQSNPNNSSGLPSHLLISMQVDGGKPPPLRSPHAQG